ncbi:Protein kinase [Hortaea werneckii]|nr:Protein kinase [Hortaea werneckii]
MNEDAAVNDIYRKIEREKAIINAATQMRQATQNASVNSRVDSQVREARRNIQYFEQTLNDLRARMSGMSVSDNGDPPPPQHGIPGGGMSGGGMNNQQGFAGGSADYGAPDQGGYSMGGGAGLMPPRAPYAPPGPSDRSPRARPNYSKLDLIKYDTAHLGPRIQLMLSQLEFKLSVEKQYKDGIDKMIRLYQMEGDRKSRADAEGRRIESNQKIQLLTRALRRYEDLHVDVENAADANDDESLDTPSQRKPLTGHLSVRIHAVAEVEHAASGRFTRGPETFVIMKVEDAFKGRTKATRTERWTDEVHEFDVDKANEIEFTVYDKSGDHSVPVGLLWIRLSDLVDEIRRKRVETEFNQAGWMTADKMADDGPRPDLQFQPPPNQQGAPAGGGATAAAAGGPPGSGLAPQTGPIYVDTWFSLEPVGRINLTLSFVKQTKDRRPFDVGLNRKGAVRQKKEDVIEQYGHKFAVQNFYNIMRCAYCGDFLKYTAGMQCTDCKYTCHKNCYQKVVTKCISKSNAETDPDEEKINHRIPHRFEQFSNMGANWCCHCGYMLPLGRRQSRKCSECKLTCHANCVHFVPDFCGMSMESANQILAELKKTKGARGRMLENSGKLRPPPSPATRPGVQQPAQSYVQAPGHQDQVLQRGDSARPEDNRFSYGKDRMSDHYDQPARTSSFGPPDDKALGAAKASMGGPSSPESAQRPPSARTQSSQNAAAAAAAALSGKRAFAVPDPRAGYPTSSRASGGYADGYHESKGYRSPPPQQTQQPPYDPAAYAAVTGYPQASPYSQPPPAQQQPPPPPAKSPYQPQAQPPQLQPTPQSPPQQQMQQQPPPNVTQPVPEERRPAPSANTVGTGRRIGLDHFNFLAVLGKGNFGKVMLAETKSSKQLYAIKVLKKEFIIENDEVESTRSEKRVFLVANKERHPFLLNLHACFQTETRIYFVMEYIAGGDLMLHIQRGQFGTKRAQFYAAEVCLALKYFHENGVIYRDLKLDNIMLTLDGHIKIADYGLCKEDMWYGSTTSTFCGTPEFMAPEILLDKKYGRAVDWWAFGVLIYQMLLQQSPFRGEDEDEIYDAILADEPLYPIHMPRDSVSILQKLLTREPELRLGSGPTDAQEIMSHAFFRNINWEDIYYKRVPAPFIPTVKNRADTSNFDSEFTSVTPVLTPVQSVLSQAMQEEFRGFSVGISEPIYGAHAIQSVAEQAQETPYTEVGKDDLAWEVMDSTNVETKTFYMTSDDGHIGLVQVIYSNVLGVKTTAQFSSKILSKEEGKPHLWASDNLSNFSFSNDKQNFKAQGCSMDISEKGDSYTIKSNTNKSSIVDLKFTRTAPGFVAGKNGTSNFGTDPAKPWGKLKHIFWPRCQVEGTILTQQGPIDFKGRGMFVHALQGMKPHFAAAKWNFANFQSPSFSAISMNFTTPKSYGETVVTVGGIATENGLLVAGGSPAVEAKHIQVKGDPDNDWPEPGAAAFTWTGKSPDGKDVTAKVEGPILPRVDRVDVMGELPKFVKQIVAGAAGTKPYIYQYTPKLKIKVNVGGEEKEEEGQLFMEATFIS